METSHAQGTARNTIPNDVLVALGDVLETARSARSFGQITQHVIVGLRVLGLLLVRTVLKERDRQYRRGPGCCPECGGTSRREKKLREKVRRTLWGKLRYKRCFHKCMDCGHRFCPLELSLALLPALRGHCEHFAKHVVILCTLMPFERGSDLFEEFFGHAVSTTFARALTLTVGLHLFDAEMTKADELWEARYEDPERFEPTPVQLRRMCRHRRVYVMMDNSKIGIHNGTRGRRASRKRKKRCGHQQYEQRRAVHAAKRKKLEDPPLDVEDYGSSDEVEGAWRDVRAVLIFREEDLADTSESRRALLRRRVVAHIGTKEEWMKLLHMAFYEEGVYTAYEVVFLADGGSGIWETFTELLPQTRFRRVVQILDWYHAAAYVWKIGRAVKGYTTKQQQKACKKWVDGILKYLAAGKVANVIQRLQRLKNLSVEAQKVVDNGVVYFEKHRARVRYAWFRKRGLLIGSGPVESVHAWVIQARCCLPGMRWSLKGANIILRLRCSWASGRWDEDFLEAARGDPLSTQDLKLAAA